MNESNDDRDDEALELASGGEGAPTPTDSKESLFGDRESNKTPSDLRGELADDSDENEEPSASEMLLRERERD